MVDWKLPPKAKIYEALSAIGDGRVRITGANTAEVVTSSGERTYLVQWSEDLTKITSNDNASVWQGYLGYPILAVLMLLGKLQYSNEVANHLSGIHWNKINQTFRRDYNRAVDFVLTELELKGVSRESIEIEVDQIMKQLETTRLERFSRRAKSPGT